MRINVYSQELTDEVIHVEKESNTGVVYHAAHPPADQVKRAASKKFGPAVLLKRWGVMRASNGCITVRMHK